MSRRETKFYLQVTIIVLFLVFILGYGIFELWKYVAGPEIHLSSPTDGSAVSESIVNVIGQVENVRLITLNDRAIVIDQAGQFKEQILLSYGYNVLVLKAEDRFGQKTEKRVQIVYK